MTNIYGLLESTTFSKWFGVININVKESHPDLWKIANETEGKKVGIELLKDRSSILIGKGKVVFETPQIYLDLYERLKKNNEICFLDDNEGYRDFVDLHKKEAEGESISRLERFKAKIKTEYFFRVGRTRLMAERIKKEKPDIAFIGAAHAYEISLNNGSDDVFIEFPVNGDSVAVNIEDALNFSYTDEEFGERLKDVSLSYSLLPAKEVPQDRLEHLRNLRNEDLGIERLHSIIEKGKIADNANPDFVGTWSLEDIPLRGFFEIYMKENGTGTIKDCLGDAETALITHENQISFSKEYKNKFNLFEKAISGKIFYEGYGNNGFYKGNYYSIESPNNGEFMMAKYSPETAQRIINSEDKNSLISQFG